MLKMELSTIPSINNSFFPICANESNISSLFFSLEYFHWAGTNWNGPSISISLEEEKYSFSYLFHHVNYFIAPVRESLFQFMMKSQP